MVEVNNNVPGKVLGKKFGKHDIKILSLFLLLVYVMMGQNHRKIVTMRLYQKNCQ